MKVHGIKSGQTITLVESLNIPDNTSIMVELEENNMMTVEKKLQKMKQFLEIERESREDLIKSLEQIDIERHIAFEKQRENCNH